MKNRRKGIGEIGKKKKRKIGLNVTLLSNFQKIFSGAEFFE